MAPRGRHKQNSQGRYKQSFRGPARRSNPSFTPLDTTPTKRTTLNNGDVPEDAVRDIAPVTPENTDTVELIKPPPDDGFDEDGLEDSDMLAVEAQTSSQKPSRMRIFTWSEADSISRPSSPLAAGETPQADWQFEDMESISKLYSSPGSGNGTFPSTMPIPKSQLDGLLPLEVRESTRGFDFSETASTAQRSTPFDLDSQFDHGWEFEDSKPPSQAVTPQPVGLSPSLLNAEEAKQSRPPGNSPEIAVQKCSRPLDIPQDEHEPHVEVSGYSGPGQQGRPSGAEGTVQRRRQRAKTPIRVDDEPSQGCGTDPSLSSPREIKIVETSLAGETHGRAPATKAKKKKTVRSTRKGLATKKASVQNPSNSATTQRKEKLPPEEPMESSWEPPRNKRTRRREAAGDDTAAPTGRPDQKRDKALDGPAANTRARVQGHEPRSNTEPRDSDMESEAQPKSPTIQNRDSDLDPPSSQSATSGNAEMSSPTGLEDSTYFVVDSAEQDSRHPESLVCPQPHGLKNAGDNEAQGVEDQGEMDCSPRPAFHLSGDTRPDQGAAAKRPPRIVVTREPRSQACSQDSPLQGIHAVRNLGPSSREILPDVRSNEGPPPVEASQKQLMNEQAEQELSAISHTRHSQVTIELSSDSDSDSDLGGSKGPEPCPPLPVGTFRNQRLEDTRTVADSERNVNNGPVEGLRLSDATPSVPQSVSKLVLPQVPLAIIPKAPTKRRPSHIEVVQKPPQENIERSNAWQKALKNKPYNVAGQFLDLNQRRGKRLLSVDNAGSPTVETNPPKRPRRGRGNSADIEATQNHSPFQLVYRDDPAGKLGGPAGTSSEECSEAVIRDEGAPVRRQGCHNPHHLGAESVTIFEGVEKRLRALATKLYATEKTYSVKMRRCLFKIHDRVITEHSTLRRANKLSLKTFRALVAEARAVMTEHKSHRQTATTQLEKLSVARRMAFDASLSELGGLQKSLRHRN